MSIFHEITARRWQPTFNYVPLYTATAADWLAAYQLEAADARQWRTIHRVALLLAEPDRVAIAVRQRIDAIIAARQALRNYRRLKVREALAAELACGDDDQIRLKGFQAARDRQWPGDNPFRFAGFERARTLWLEGFRLWWENRETGPGLPILH